jgi:hypothetical protein
VPVTEQRWARSIHEACANALPVSLPCMSCQRCGAVPQKRHILMPRVGGERRQEYCLVVVRDSKPSKHLFDSDTLYSFVV